MKNYYQTLQISPNSSKIQIENAYKRLALIWHPTKYHLDKKMAEQMFHDVSEAYDVLSDQNQRMHYDFFLKNQVSLDDAQKNFATMFPNLHVNHVQNSQLKKPVTVDFTKKDYYSILGVSRFASQEQIESAYRKLAEKYHPGNNYGNYEDNLKFMEIDKAYRALKYQVGRKTYDKWYYNEYSQKKSDQIFQDFFKNRDYHESEIHKPQFIENIMSEPVGALKPVSNTKQYTGSYKTETYYTKHNNQETKKTVTVKKQIHDGKLYERRKQQTSFPDGNREIVETVNENGYITTNKLELLPGQSVPNRLMY